MATYDPKRNRPPVGPAPDDEPAPVEGLLVDLREDPPAAQPVPARRIVDELPAPDPLTGRIAAVAGLAAAAAVLVMVWRRRRRR
jgi:hypothetical protein